MNTIYTKGDFQLEPIFLEPYFREKIWGGDKLHTEFNFDLPSDSTGEAWVISSHKNGQSTVTYPESLKGMGLSELYKERPELFGVSKPETFPLLVKILDANKDLSVQVHPSDKYAKIHENDLGKTECWYIVSAEPEAKIIYGHNAKSKEEFRELIDREDWGDLLREIPVKTGDFYFVPHGTIHAIGKGIVILEIQQNSDTTYRVYDYDRTDDDGNKRDLHIEQSIEVSNIPHSVPELNIQTNKYPGGNITHYLTNEYFSVYKWDIWSELELTTSSPYTLATVINGSGRLIVGNHSYFIEKSHSFILPNDLNHFELHGNLEIIASFPKQ